MIVSSYVSLWCALAIIITSHNNALSLYAVILVGFEMSLLSVNESAGLVELCVRIFTRPALFPNHTEINFSLSLISTPGSAGKLNG